MSEWTNARDFVAASLEAVLTGSGAHVYPRLRRTDDPNVAKTLFFNTTADRLNAYFVTRVETPPPVYRCDMVTRDHVALVHGFYGFHDEDDDDEATEDAFQGQCDLVLAGLWARRAGGGAYGVTVAKPPTASYDLGSAQWLAGALCHHVEIRWPLSITSSVATVTQG